MGYQARIAFMDGDGRRWKGAHRTDFEGLRAVLESVVVAGDDWIEALPGLATPIGKFSDNVVQVQLEGVESTVIVKRIPPDRGPVLDWVAGQSRAARAYDWAHRLRAFGLDTPRPLGFVERRSSPRGASSFIATEFIGAPTLEQLRDRALAGIDKRDLIDRLATLYAALHTHGLLHADLHVGNLLVTDDALFVLDLESMRPMGVRSSVVMKNLVRLNRDFLDTDLVSRSDRMRFVDRYLRHQADRKSRRRTLFEAIQRRTEAKLVERGERFSAAGTADGGGL